MKHRGRLWVGSLFVVLSACWLGQLPASAEDAGTLGEPQILRGVRVTIGHEDEWTVVDDGSDLAPGGVRPASEESVSEVMSVITLCTEGFEDGFPQGGDCGPWTLRWGGLGWTWDDVQGCRSSVGSSAAWCANGYRNFGGDGYEPCDESYPNGSSAFMIAGPFDLSDATGAEVLYDWWVRCQSGNLDRLFVASSTDGQSFAGEFRSGDFGDQWHRNERFDLQAVVGRSEVWVAFAFFSNSNTTVPVIPNGAFVDEVRIRKTVGATADLEVQDIDFLPSANCATEARAYVRNVGEADAPSTICRISLDGNALCDKTVPALQPGQAVWTDYCDLGSYGPGNRSVTARADATNLIQEIDEENNLRTEFISCLRPDLIVSQLELDSPDCPGGARALVRNIGQAASSASLCQISLDGDPLCNLQVPALAVNGEAWTSWCTLEGYAAGDHTLEACADAGSVVIESDETNNCLPGSFTCSIVGFSFEVASGLSFDPGDTAVRIPIRGSNSEPILGLGFRFEYDPLVLGYQGVSTTGTRCEGAEHVQHSGAAGSGRVGVLFSFLCPDAIPPGDDTFIDLVFNVLPNAPGGPTEIRLVEDQRTLNRMTLCDATSVVPEVVDGSVLIHGSGFIRGDADANGAIDITDALLILHYQYGGGEAPACMDAADFNDSGALDLADVLGSLNYQFANGPPPAAPFGACGPDPTADGLTCVSYPPCGLVGEGARVARVENASDPMGSLHLVASLSQGGDSLLVEMDLEADDTLIGGEWELAFDGTVLDFQSLQQTPGESAPHDFLAAREGESGGTARVAFIPRFDLSEEIQWTGGRVGRCVFRILDSDRLAGSRIDRVGGSLYDKDLARGDLAGDGISLASLDPRLEGGRILFRNPYLPGSPIRIVPGFATQVRVAVFDVQGKEVQIIGNGEIGAGGGEWAWTGETNLGAQAPAGVYYVRIALGAETFVRKIVLVR